MVWSSWSGFGGMLGVAGLLAALALPAPEPETRAYGKHLVAKYQLPASSIERYAALAAGKAGHEAPSGNSRFADRVPWVGPELSAGAGHNPYVLVLSVSGVATAAGDVHSEWQAGWEVHESRNENREVVLAIPGPSMLGVAAGERVSLTGASGPVSFRGQRDVSPMLGLVHMHNLKIDAVQVQVWSGMAALAWPAARVSARALLATLSTGLLLWLLAGLRSCAPPANRIPPANSPEPRDPASAVDILLPGSTAGTALPPVDAPSTSHKTRVFEALNQVLTVGLCVTTVFDDARTSDTQTDRQSPAAGS